MNKINIKGAIVSMLITTLSFTLIGQVSQIDNTILLVDGQSYFPYGIYTEGIYNDQDYLAILDSISKTSMNTIWIESNAVSEMTYQTFYDRVDSLELKTIVGLPIESQFPADFVFWLNFHKTYNEVLGWDILDDSNNFPISELINQKNQLLLHDTSRISSQSMYALGIVQAFNAWTEVTAMQGYPWGNGSDNLSDTYNTFSGFCDTVKLNGHVPIVNNQVFNWTGETYPSADHFDCQTYLSIVCGAKGVINYTYLDYEQAQPISQTQPDLWAQLKILSSELSEEEIQNFLLFGNYERIRINDYVAYAVWELNGEILFIIFNSHATNTEQISIDMTEYDIVNKTNYYSYRPDYLTLNAASTLSGNMPPYGIAIYSFDQTSSSEFNIERNSISIFPNPTNNRLTVHGISYYYQIKIIDSNGSLIEEIDGNGDIDFDLSTYPYGTYFVVLENKANQNLHVTKIVKQ